MAPAAERLSCSQYTLTLLSTIGVDGLTFRVCTCSVAPFTFIPPDVGRLLFLDEVECRRREKSEQSDVEHMNKYNDWRDEYLIKTAYRNDGGILSKLATCLLDFKNITLQCIAHGKESRSFYQDCIEAMLVICKEAARIALEPLTRRNTSRKSRKLNKSPTALDTDTTQVLPHS